MKMWRLQFDLLRPELPRATWFPHCPICPPGMDGWAPRSSLLAPVPVQE